MKPKETFVTKDQLTDYVTKREFSDFVESMDEFKEDVINRFDRIDTHLKDTEFCMHNFEKSFTCIDKRLLSLDKRVSRIEENVRIQIGTALDEFDHRLQVGFDHFQGQLDTFKKDTDEKFNDIKREIGSMVKKDTDDKLNVIKREITLVIKKDTEDRLSDIKKEIRLAIKEELTAIMVAK